MLLRKSYHFFKDYYNACNLMDLKPMVYSTMSLRLKPAKEAERVTVWQRARLVRCENSFCFKNQI